MKCAAATSPIVYADPPSTAQAGQTSDPSSLNNLVSVQSPLQRSGIAVDTDLLTSALQENGYLDEATVLSVALTPMDSNGLGAEFFTAELQYSSTQPRLPSRMVVKKPLLGDRGAGEATVYERVLRGQSGLPVLECFAVIDENPTAPLAFLFEDLTATHTQTTWPIIPSLEQCTQAVTALAEVHANWWGNTSSIDAGTPPIARHQDTENLVRFFPGFVEMVGEYFPVERVSCYEHVFEQLDALVDRRLATGIDTLLHSDPHYWNFLFPQEPAQGRCVLFDWPLWRTGAAGSDLAYMIALHLYPEHRSRFEATLLDRYHAALVGCGIEYTRDDLDLDYRIGVIAGLLMPIMEFSWSIPPSDWMPKLEKAFAAFDDLECHALLDGT